MITHNTKPHCKRRIALQQRQQTSNASPNIHKRPITYNRTPKHRQKHQHRTIKHGEQEVAHLTASAVNTQKPIRPQQATHQHRYRRRPRPITATSADRRAQHQTRKRRPASIDIFKENITSPLHGPAPAAGRTERTTGRPTLPRRSVRLKRTNLRVRGLSLNRSQQWTALLRTTPRLRTRSSTNDLAPLHRM